MNVMNQMRYTTIGLVCISLMIFNIIFFKFDLFEYFAYLLERLEAYEIDEIIIPFMLLIPFIIVDVIRKSIKTKIENARTLESERFKTYTAMVYATQQILNNFLNKAQLFNLRARNTPNFDKNILEQYEQMIAATSAQVVRISQLTDIKEESIIASINEHSSGPTGIVDESV